MLSFQLALNHNSAIPIFHAAAAIFPLKFCLLNIARNYNLQYREGEAVLKYGTRETLDLIKNVIQVLKWRKQSRN